MHNSTMVLIETHGRFIKHSFRLRMWVQGKLWNILLLYDFVFLIIATSITFPLERAFSDCKHVLSGQQGGRKASQETNLEGRGELRPAVCVESVLCPFRCEPSIAHSESLLTGGFILVERCVNYWFTVAASLKLWAPFLAWSTTQVHRPS